MLNVFYYSIIVGIVVTILIAGIADIYFDVYTSVISIIFTFFFTAIGTVIILYVFCIEQTILGIVRWLWPVFIIECIVYFFIEEADEYIDAALILAAISGVFCLSGILAPKQILISNIDSNYYNNKIELIQLDNYEVSSPEPREISGDVVMVYQIHNLGKRNSQIPGYLIQKRKDEKPELVSKPIYFDSSNIGSRNVSRRLRKEYPTLILGEYKFDIDDNGNIYEICVYRENFYKSNCKDDYGLVTISLKDGTCQKYKQSEIPKWIDFKSTVPK